MLRISTFLFLGLIGLGSLSGYGQSGTELNYNVSIDLLDLQQDELPVSFRVNNIPSDTVVFAMPSIVPGTYSIYDFGRFVESIHALSTSGDTLAVSRLDTNRWQITHQKGEDIQVEYRISDTFDHNDYTEIFEPAGTSFEVGENFVLNLFGMVGFLDEYEDSPYELRIIKPDGFYGSSSMPGIDRRDSMDVFTAPDYFTLHDNPILYAEPDTATLNVSGLKVEMAVYSPSGMVTAKEALNAVAPVLKATGEYLDGEMPVDHYNILLYLASRNNPVGGYGALEHNHSTVVILPDLSVSLISSSLREVVAHEFLHIITPLNIHSEYIHNYDFLDPKMSRHLWLYEGCTEYFAHLVQVRDDLYTDMEFMNVLQKKMAQAERYGNSVSFTEMSRGALDQYSSMYGNVYQKGPLICMCTDLEIRRLTDGKMDIGLLMDTLSQKYGPDKPFIDSLLFDEIASLTHPEMKDFFDRYVAGNEPLPYERLFAEAGYVYKDSTQVPTPMLAGVQLDLAPDSQHLKVVNTEGITELGKELKIKEGDVILSWNDRPMNVSTFNTSLMNYLSSAKKGDKLVVEVLRSDDSGKERRKELKARVITKQTTEYNLIRPEEDAGKKELKFREQWLSN